MKAEMMGLSEELAQLNQMNTFKVALPIQGKPPEVPTLLLQKGTKQLRMKKGS